ncbi:MAG TPA: sulfotransferase domain-containing protein [Caulobacter sp.]|nr:sulfotransferase domain-containing protein [Caulobacter sp.]
MTVAVIRTKPDTLNAEVRRFAQAPLRRTAFLNSVPKCGTHLLRNIVRMFVPVEQHYDREFIQIQNLEQHRAGLDPRRPAFSTGHLVYADIAALTTQHARQVVLVRDPYDYVLSRARFIFSDEFQNPLMEPLKKAGTVEQVINFMIFGVPAKAPGVREIFTAHAVAWMHTGVTLVRYEDIVRELKRLDTDEAEAFFRGLLDAFGIDLPGDWRARVLAGSDRKHSATDSAGLSGVPTFPKALSEGQKALVDFAAPGLRSLLGYG